MFTQVLPSALLTLACHLKPPDLREDLRHRLLSLCSNVGLIAEARSFRYTFPYCTLSIIKPTCERAPYFCFCKILPCGRSGPTALGCLLPAVAESLTDFCPISALPTPLLKLFRNLWFYISLYNLAPPPPERGGAGRGEYPWDQEWATAVTRIAESTPPLVLAT